MVAATALTGIPMLVMGFTTPATSIVIYFVALAFTGTYFGQFASAGRGAKAGRA